eukprot:PhM_4_TR18020/c3_g5_i2/m.93223
MLKTDQHDTPASTCDPSPWRISSTSDAFADFDREFRVVTERILQPMSADQWAQAELPLRHGGLGLRPCHPFAAIARAAARRSAAPTASLGVKTGGGEVRRRQHKLLTAMQSAHLMAEWRARDGYNTSALLDERTIGFCNMFCCNG